MAMILHGDLRDEFLCTPELVRAVLTDENQLALAVKAPLSHLKYLIAAESISLTLIPLHDGCLAYVLEIPDDPIRPAYVWSAVESENELAALQRVDSGAPCDVHLFNEIAVNVASTSVQFEHRSGAVDLSADAFRVSQYGEHDRFDEIDAGITRMKARDPRVEALHAHRSEPWAHVKSYYYSTGSGPSFLSVFDPNEGTQQEALGLWLTDTFAIGGAHLNPNVAAPNTPGKKRELCDILIAEDTHTFVIQSKVLAILARQTLPTRAKLHADTVKRVHDALGQAVGAVRRLRLGDDITDTEGKEIQVDRVEPMHIIVLVPDLSLLSATDNLGGQFLRDTAAETGCFVHILDPTQLLRVAQSVTVLATGPTRLSKVMHLDAYLIHRFERALEINTPHFDFRLRFTDREKDTGL
ncbi:hypothetical protein [Mycobacteroides abscessus]|uniref:hypothetical protein n=1 Tax=Mycobacteroides abscessus TaxID=36809 RepID=UPI0021034B3A|nr:hypothetical protein [Mycobacteroides abscessus]